MEIAFLPHWWDGGENIKFSDRKRVCVLHTCGLKSLMELEYMFPDWESFFVQVSIFKERSQGERGRSAAHPQPVPTEPSRGPDKNISELFEWLGSCW